MIGSRTAVRQLWRQCSLAESCVLHLLLLLLQSMPLARTTSWAMKRTQYPLQWYVRSTRTAQA